SFYDDKSILDQMTQKYLMDQIVERAKRIKREIIGQYSRNPKELKKIYLDTIESNRRGNQIWVPSSHFFVDKDVEHLLQTLELYFIVTKFNEGSSRNPSKKASFFGLNYGLCLENSIDYGRPEFRRTYDYWRQDEFDVTTFLPDIIENIEVPICNSCGYEYTDEAEYRICEKFLRCVKCGQQNSVTKINKASKETVQKWLELSLPDLCVDILRMLNNNQVRDFSAHELGLELDKHHLSITKAMDKLYALKLVEYKYENRRYYKISQNAIDKYFSD
ncbi:MAG: hypothetical protein AAGU01_05895, partial [Clostridiaceae bacterium]